MRDPSNFSSADINDLNQRFAQCGPRELLQWAADTFGDRIALCSAFGPEGIVLLHYISSLDRTIKVFTLDTGRLPSETYELMQECEERYGIRIKAYSPDPAAAQEMVETHGINLFYKSVAHRELCCEIRKVRPLIEALRGLSAWITGLRSSQSTARSCIKKIELDALHDNIVKVNPLAGWQEKEVWDYIAVHRLPYNALHDRGYRSIGCACCTRPTNPGEDMRAGRWWWEQNGKQECGIHTRGVDEAQVVIGNNGASGDIMRHGENALNLKSPRVQMK